MSRTLLYVEDVSVSFDGFKALDLKHFQLEEGELRVIIGPNGAGKTTFLDVLCGKTHAATGHARLDGYDLVQMNEQEIVAAGVARKFQTPTVFGSLPVYDNLLLAVKGPRGVWRSLFYKPDSRTTDRVMAVATIIGLTDHLPRLAETLSHGQKQWLEIGMVMLQDPKLMLIDEPAAGMTDDETHKTGELLLELAGQHTIIVIEHDMEFVRQIAQTVTVFSEGKLLVEGPMEQVQNDPRVIECYLGSAHTKTGEAAA